MSKKAKQVTKHEQVDEEKALLKAQLVRALADYDNLQKRVVKEQAEQGKKAGLRVALRVMEALDVLDRVQNHLQDPGLAVAIQGFVELLASEGIEAIKVQPGDKFDENLHEAVELIEGNKKGSVGEVVQAGWRLADGQVIRPAKVKVVK